MSNSQFRLGFIGGGINSAVGATHKIASQMDGRWILEAGCFSRHSDINISTAKNWGVNEDRLYDSPDLLLENEKGQLDAIVILTPTTQHSDLIIKAIKNGYAVICEKALVTSSAEAKKINKVVKKYNAFLAVTYNYTGYPMLRELRQIIKKGELGKLNKIQIEMPQEGFKKLDMNGAPIKPQSWRLKDENIPIISLDLGVHLVHMISFLSKKSPIEVTAVQSNSGNFQGIIDDVVCMAKYTDNLLAQIWFSKIALGHSNGLKVQVYGDKGSAEWFQMESEYLLLNDLQGGKNILTRSSNAAKESVKPIYNRFKAGHPSGFIEAFANHYYDLADSLLEYQHNGYFSSPWVFSSIEAEEGLIMLEAMSKSSTKNRWQKVS